MEQPIVSRETSRREMLRLSGMGLLGGAAVTALTPGRAQAEGQPNVSYASWVQGYIMQVENPDRLDVDSRIGWCAFVMGKPGTENWFHFAIPTPVIINDVRLAVPNTPAMSFGMGISVGVSFGVEAMDHGMKFYGVGCDFVTRPSA